MIGHLQILSTGAWYSNELQWLDFNIRHQDIRPHKRCEVDMPYSVHLMVVRALFPWTLYTENLTYCTYTLIPQLIWLSACKWLTIKTINIHYRLKDECVHHELYETLTYTFLYISLNEWLWYTNIFPESRIVFKYDWTSFKTRNSYNGNQNEQISCIYLLYILRTCSFTSEYRLEIWCVIKTWWNYKYSLEILI